MAVATTNNTDIAYSKELVKGQINASPEFQIIPTTGGSPVQNITTAVSEVIRSDRQTTDLIKTDVEVSGDINYELDYPNYKPLMKSLLMSDTANTPAVSAVGTYIISGTAAGDGVVGLNIDAAPYTITPSAADNATVMGDALVTVINLGATHTAVNAVGTITITAVVPGVAGNSVVFTDVTTDTGTTGTPTSPTGGADEIPVDTGFDISALTLSTTGSTLSGAGVETQVAVGDVFWMSSATNPDNNMARVVADVTGPDMIVFSPAVPSGTTDGSTDVNIKATEILTNGATCDFDSYTIRKNVEACGSSTYSYYYKGCMINTMNFNIATASILNGSMGIVGLTEQVETGALPGEIEFDSLPYSIMNAISSVAVIDIEGVDLGVCKFNSFDLTYDNQINIAKSIGTEGGCDSAAFSVQITSNIEAYFSNIDMYNAFINSLGFGVTLILQDGDGNIIGINLPYCKFETLDTPISGKDQFLMQSGSLRALMDPDLGYMCKFTFIDGA